LDRFKQGVLEKEGHFAHQHMTEPSPNQPKVSP
jgi:hypothetical protein